MKSKLKLINTAKSESLPEFGFEQIDANTLRLQFGQARIELKADGSICFQNNSNHLLIKNEEIQLKTSRAEIGLNANGNIVIDGVNVKQSSEKHISLNAKQNVYLNSQ